MAPPVLARCSTARWFVGFDERARGASATRDTDARNDLMRLCEAPGTYKRHTERGSFSFARLCGLCLPPRNSLNAIQTQCWCPLQGRWLPYRGIRVAYLFSVQFSSLKVPWYGFKKLWRSTLASGQLRLYIKYPRNTAPGAQRPLPPPPPRVVGHGVGDGGRDHREARREVEQREQGELRAACPRDEAGPLRAPSRGPREEGPSEGAKDGRGRGPTDTPAPAPAPAYGGGGGRHPWGLWGRTLGSRPS